MIPRALPCVALATILSSWPAMAAAADVHVGPSATGNGSGIDWTNQAAWSSVALARGNTYYLADGTYGSKSLSTPTSGATFIVVRKATATAHGSSTGWSTALGDGAATFVSASLTVTTSYWDIDGVTGGGPGSWKTGHGIVFTSNAGTALDYVNISSGVSHLFVRHCAFNQVGDTTKFSVMTSAFYDAGDLLSSTIEHCYMDNIGGLPFFFRHGSGNIIQYNYTGDICGASVYDANQHCEALVIHDMDDLHFRWNYIAECPSSGGVVKNNTQTSADIRIYGNTFEKGFPINCNTGPCPNWRIFNNTFHSTSGGPFGGDGAVSGLLYYNNVTFKASMGPGVFGTHGYNWFSQISSSSCSTGASSSENILLNVPPTMCDDVQETLDPFVASSGHLPEDFLLKGAIAGWPGTDTCALDACVGEKKYNVDAFGHVRGADGTWDRGAYEHVSGMLIDASVKKDASITKDLSVAKDGSTKVDKRPSSERAAVDQSRSDGKPAAADRGPPADGPGRRDVTASNPDTSGCSCQLGGTDSAAGGCLLWVLLSLLVASAARDRRSRPAGATNPHHDSLIAMRIALLSLISSLLLGCGGVSYPRGDRAQDAHLGDATTDRSLDHPSGDARKVDASKVDASKTDVKKLDAKKDAPRKDAPITTDFSAPKLDTKVKKEAGPPAKDWPSGPPD